MFIIGLWKHANIVHFHQKRFNKFQIVSLKSTLEVYFKSKSNRLKRFYLTKTGLIPVMS